MEATFKQHRTWAAADDENDLGIYWHNEAVVEPPAQRGAMSASLLGLLAQRVRAHRSMPHIVDASVIVARTQTAHPQHVEPVVRVVVRASPTSATRGWYTYTEGDGLHAHNSNRSSEFLRAHALSLIATARSEQDAIVSFVSSGPHAEATTACLLAFLLLLQWLWRRRCIGNRSTHLSRSTGFPRVRYTSSNCDPCDAAALLLQERGRRKDPRPLHGVPAVRQPDGPVLAMLRVAIAGTGDANAERIAAAIAALQRQRGLQLSAAVNTNAGANASLSPVLPIAAAPLHANKSTATACATQSAATTTLLHPVAPNVDHIPLVPVVHHVPPLRIQPTSAHALPSILAMREDTPWAPNDSLDVSGRALNYVYSTTTPAPCATEVQSPSSQLMLSHHEPPLQRQRDAAEDNDVTMAVFVSPRVDVTGAELTAVAPSSPSTVELVPPLPLPPLIARLAASAARGVKRASSGGAEVAVALAAKRARLSYGEDAEPSAPPGTTLFLLPCTPHDVVRTRVPVDVSTVTPVTATGTSKPAFQPRVVASSGGDISPPHAASRTAAPLSEAGMSTVVTGSHRRVPDAVPMSTVIKEIHSQVPDSVSARQPRWDTDIGLCLQFEAAAT